MISKIHVIFKNVYLPELLIVFFLLELGFIIVCVNQRKYIEFIYFDDVIILFQLVLRENDLIDIPKEIGYLPRLRELHIQANRLTVLPPELGNLDLFGNKSVLRMDFNPWVAPIADQLQVGVSHVIDYIRSETYR